MAAPVPPLDAADPSTTAHPTDQEG
jgi:hypothetical protein